MKRFEIVDYLKGYSIFTILIYHYLTYLNLPNPFDQYIYFGGTGVHLFILLSGFGLYYSYTKKPVTYLSFIKRRISKIYIPYIFVVLISALISLFIPIYKNSLYALGGHVFLYKMFDESIMESYGYHLWFISMIIQFYFAFHAIVWLKSKLKNKFFLLSAIIVSIGWAVFVFLINKESERIWSSFFLQYYWEFALGIVLAEIVTENGKLINKSINQLLLLAIGLINCSLFGFLALRAGDVGKLFNDFFALTGYSLLAIVLYNLEIKPINQLFLFIGKISLSVYLLHIVVLLILINLFNNLNTIYIVIISLIIIFPVSSIFQKIVNIFFKINKL